MGKTSRWLKSLLGMKRDNQTPIPTADENKKNKRNKRRWSFTHSRPESAPPPRRMSLNIGDASCRRKHFPTKEEEEDNDDQAITVAAAAAEAAVAAAQAAMAVVRLANKGRSVAATTAAKERWAALHIQNVFRGYLARKALRALKGLVKLQAHVRGYLVRKRAAATLQCMQALIRAQAAAHFLRLPPSSKEGFDESNSSKMMSDCCYEEDSPKIVEIDTYKPRSSVRPNNNGFTAQYGDRYTCPYSMSGPIEGPYLTPARLSLPSRRYDYDYDYDFEGGPRHNYVRQFQFRNHRRTSTAQSTPRFTDWADGPFTQAKPVWDEGPFRTFQYRQAQHPPNYMASTQSFEAKSTTRSQSAPKQRLNQPSPSKKKMPLEKLMECRRSLSGIKMNRSYSEDREAFQF